MVRLLILFVASLLIASLNACNIKSSGGASSQTVTVTSLPAGETSVSIASNNGFNSSFYGDFHLFQVVVGSSSSIYLLAIWLNGTVDNTFGVNGWLNLSTLAGGTSLANSAWEMCNGNLYVYPSPPDGKTFALFQVSLTGTPTFTPLNFQTVVTPNTPIRDMVCNNNILLATWPNASGSYLASFDGTHYLSSNDTGPNFLVRIPLYDSGGNIWSYSGGSTNYFFEYSGSLALLNSLSLDPSIPSLQGGIFASPTDMTFYGYSGQQAVFYAGTVSALFSSLLSPAPPLFSYTFTAPGSGNNLSYLGACRSNGKFLVYEQAFNSGSSTWLHSALLLSSTGIPVSSYNGGSELVLNQSPYNTSSGNNHLSIACDDSTKSAVLGYQTSSGLSFALIDSE